MAWPRPVRPAPLWSCASPVKCGARAARAFAHCASSLMACRWRPAPLQQVAGQVRRQGGQGPHSSPLIDRWPGWRQRLALQVARQLRCQRRPGPTPAVFLVADGQRRGQRSSSACRGLAGQVRRQGGQGLRPIPLIRRWPALAASASRKTCRGPRPSTAAPGRSGPVHRCSHRRWPCAAASASCQQVAGQAAVPGRLGPPARPSSPPMACVVASACCQYPFTHLARQVRRQGCQGLRPIQLIADGLRRGQRLRQNLVTVISGKLRRQCYQHPRTKRFIADGLRRSQRISEHVACQVRCQCRQHWRAGPLMFEGLCQNQRLSEHFAGQVRCQGRLAPVHDSSRSQWIAPRPVHALAICSRSAVGGIRARDGGHTAMVALSCKSRTCRSTLSARSARPHAGSRARTTSSGIELAASELMLVRISA